MDETVNSRVEIRPATSRRITRAMRDCAVLVGTFLLGHLPGFVLSRRAGLSFKSASTWARWDSGLYLDIVNNGYHTAHCQGVPNRTPADWCGNAGWFPGYPVVGRALTWFGFRSDSALLLVARFFFLAMLALLWFGFLRSRPNREAVPAMLLAAFFPGGVYYLALFPMALATFGLLLLLWGVDRQRSVLAGVGAAVAAFTYPVAAPAGVIVAVGVLLHPSGRKKMIRSVVGSTLGSLVGTLGAFTYLHAGTGQWTAYFKSQAGYHHELAFPLIHIVRRIVRVVDPRDAAKSVTAMQNLLVLGLIVAITCALIAKKTWPTLIDFTILLLAIGLYLSSNIYGLTASEFRHESLLFPLVILVRRTRSLQWVFVPAAFVIASQMMTLFFANQIV